MSSHKLIGTTQMQANLLSFITDEYERHGVAPSYDEMRQHLGLRSKSGVHRLVHALKDRGHIHLQDRRARSIAPRVAKPPLSEAIQDVMARCSLTKRTQAELRAILEAEVRK